jgi:hypothetical protein
MNDKSMTDFAKIRSWYMVYQERNPVKQEFGLGCVPRKGQEGDCHLLRENLEHTLGLLYATFPADIMNAYPKITHGGIDHE